MSERCEKTNFGIAWTYISWCVIRSSDIRWMIPVYFFVIKCEKFEIASRMNLDDMAILGETASGDYWWGTAEQ